MTTNTFSIRLQNQVAYPCNNEVIVFLNGCGKAKITNGEIIISPGTKLKIEAIVKE